MTTGKHRAKIKYSFINQTVDVEIKTERALTESPGGWEPGRTQAVKWTTEGAVKGICRVFRDVWHTSVARDMSVSC